MCNLLNPYPITVLLSIPCNRLPWPRQATRTRQVKHYAVAMQQFSTNAFSYTQATLLEILQEDRYGRVKSLKWAEKALRNAHSVRDWGCLQFILFEIDCTIFYTNLHELFGQFITWTNWVNSGKYMDNCWISC